jgi:Flp pilus assembly protein TadG
VFAPLKLIQLLWRDSDGSALVEATLLTPVLIFLFFGVFEFSRYFYNQQVVETGVRDAARYLARGPYFTTKLNEDTDPCQDATNRLAAQNIAVTGTADGSGAARVTGWTIADVQITCRQFPNPYNGVTYAAPNPFYSVTVRTSFPDAALGYFGMLGLGTPNLSSSHMERFFGSG